MSIHPRTLQAFREKVAQAMSQEKIAIGLGTVGLLGLGGVGALGLSGAAGLGGNVYRDMQYGRAERLEEKARRMKAIMAAKSMPTYNEGGMH